MRRGGPAWDAVAWFGAIVAAGLVIALALSFCDRPPGPAGAATPAPGPATGSSPAPIPASAGPWTPPRATKTTGCSHRRAADQALLPDQGCTTGATDASLPTSALCAASFRAADHRRVSESLKSRIYGAYGVARAAGSAYEIDHLIPIEVGGSNDPENLWPQPADPAPGYREKDRVENWLRDQVCAGAVSLAAAQRQIATDWTAYLPPAFGAAPKIHVGDDEAD